MEDFFNLFLSIHPLYIYLLLFSFAFVENLIPPLPSDTFVVLGGTLLSNSVISFFPAVISTSLGSLFGFMVVFYFGYTLTEKIEEHKFIKFVKPETVQTVHNLFEKWGYGVIIANRFLPGTRAIVSFCAGVAKMDFKIVSIISFISSFLWNSLLLYVGSSIGSSLTSINNFFAVYNKIVWTTLTIILLYFIFRYFYKKLSK